MTGFDDLEDLFQPVSFCEVLEKSQQGRGVVNAHKDFSLAVLTQSCPKGGHRALQ